MKKHVNIPIFIPHLGCPNQCVFCNQRKISGVEQFKLEDVKTQIDTALSTVGSDKEAEIAFFGGSFTGIDRALMLNLLEISHNYLKEGKVASVRCSTRPDYINEEIIDILKRYGVGTVELGIQSSSDEILSRSKRGHNVTHSKRAAELIVNSGITFVGQMMVGLPGSTLEDEIETAEFIISSGAKAARIYPTVVFSETELSEMTDRGEYIPLSLEEAVFRCAVLLKKFSDASVDVIRLGLCESENLHSEKSYYCGPNHPALGELTENMLYFLEISEKLTAIPDIRGEIIKITVSKNSLSKAIGQKRVNRIRLCEKYGLENIIFTESEKLSGYDFFIEKVRKNKCT